MNRERDLCNNCIFWFKQDQSDGDLVRECRRRSPQSISENWPSTYHYEWCGEHQRVPDEVTVLSEYVHVTKEDRDKYGTLPADPGEWTHADCISVDQLLDKIFQSPTS